MVQTILYWQGRTSVVRFWQAILVVKKVWLFPGRGGRGRGMKVLIKDIVHIMCPWKETRKVSLMAHMIKDIKKWWLKYNAMGSTVYFREEGCCILQYVRFLSKISNYRLYILNAIHEWCLWSLSYKSLSDWNLYIKYSENKKKDRAQEN